MRRLWCWLVGHQWVMLECPQSMSWSKYCLSCKTRMGKVYF